ncbi:MAG: hypothetical protein RIB67_04705 [Miltoncostaeaceae bacterium]
MEIVLLTAAALTAAAAGITGAWSPCGFSMVDTLGSAAGDRGRRTMAVACATFALGAVVGGVLTFGGLALIGASLHGADATLALIAAAAVAGVAAVAEVMGWRIAPQIRRQVPQHWRWTMPLPVAAGLYGVLLGLGFTTFVLTFAVWALAGVSIALGSPAIGLAIGLGFGLGRAIPVVAMAPRMEGAGERMLMAMAERPRLLGRLRRVDAALLAVLALSIGAVTAGAAEPVARGALDPSVEGTSLAWVDGAGALVDQPSGPTRLVGARAVAVTGGLVVSEGTIPSGRGLLVHDRTGLPTRIDRTTPGREGPAPVAVRRMPGVSALSASGEWVVWRRDRPGGGDIISAARLPDLSGARTLIASRVPGELGRPKVRDGRVVFAVNQTRRSRIVLHNLATGRSGVIRDSITLTQFRDPSLDAAGNMLFVAAGYCQQQLRLEPLGRPGRGLTLLRLGSSAVRDAGREPGRTLVGTSASGCPASAPAPTLNMMDATAAGPGAAYVTISRQGGTLASARIVRVVPRGR